MPSGYRLALHLVVLSFIILGAIGMIKASTPSGMHLGNSECANCHIAGAKAREGAATLLSSEENLCTPCHAQAMKAMHPSGFPPGRPLPAAYPVDWKGDVTCSTCHSIHGSGAGLLRGGSRGRQFCLACHDQAFFRRMRDGGVSLMASRRWERATDWSRADLDPYSLQCMECHGAMGDTNAVRVDANAVIRHARGNANHPIGRRYASAARYGGYRPETLVTRTLFLPDGRVSCVSCHQPFSKDHGKLVLAGNRSALCFECHDL